MDEFGQVDRPPDDDGGGEHFLLGGGPVLPGVDYEGAWLRARGHAQALNRTFAELGLSDTACFAQARWADDGSGLVVVSVALDAAARLREVLEKGAAAGG